MNELFDFELLTPEKIAYTGKTSSVSCPGTEGRFQILRNHAPFLSSLAAGELRVTEESGAIVRYAISGGVSQVFHNTMLVLADAAERPEDIDVARARAAQSRAEQRLERHDPGIDIDRARAALLRAINRLKVARGS